MTIRVRERVGSSLYERSYFPEVLRGLWVTFSHLAANLFGPRAAATWSRTTTRRR